MLNDHARKTDSSHVPIPSGTAYRVDSPPAGTEVTPELANELQQVLERFAREAGFTKASPLDVVFRPGVVGHHKVARAADIYAVGGIGIGQWKQRWDEGMQRAARAAQLPSRKRILLRQRKRNLGWRLYRALQRYGRWSQPYGLPIQLFGPWTRTEGPWRYISDRLLHAHRDHIHVAK